MERAQILEGKNHIDDRGVLRFFNNFAMDKIVRFYEIAPSSTEIVRAWQGHKKESKWFYCTQGSFKIQLIKVDDFDRPSEDLQPEIFTLTDRIAGVLHVPGGYASGFKAIEENSKMMVYSDMNLVDSSNDDFRFPMDKWVKKW
ncbi:cupin domain-containing protein [Spongiimicrobium salis]|uniref:hypothetical protein n=1 Tax=Spongiimicrobium salis TaxID=1667022 RepID=UPI00374D06B8